MSERDTGPDSVHWLDLGPDPDVDSHRRQPRPWRWWSALVIAMLVAALLLARNQQGHPPLAGPAQLAVPSLAGSASSGSASSGSASSGSASSGSASSGSAASGSATGGRPSHSMLRGAGSSMPGGAAAGTSAAGPVRPDAGPVTTTDLGRPLLDVPDGWELFGQGEGVMVRMELARGRITRTAMPQLGSASPIHFVVGQDRAIIHPMDWVPGYVVHDGKPATRLPPALSQAASTLPGPDPWHLWAETEAGTGSALTLLTLDGRPAGVQIPIPPDATVQASDRAGNVLIFGVGGMYDARPDGMHRITSGTLLAVGPTRWLALECDERYRCAGAVIDRGTGARRALRTPLDSYAQNAGAVSPDGRMAALLQPNGVRGSNVHLLDLDTGAVRVTGVKTRSHQTLGGRALVWSPDSRWLFATDGAGEVLAVDRAGKPVVLDAQVGLLDQLALRTARR